MYTPHQQSPLIETDISLSEAEFLAEQTRAEKNLQTKTAAEIYANATQNGCIALRKIPDKIIGFIELTARDYQDHPIYERGTLRVDPSHRQQGRGTKLIRSLTDQHLHQPLISLTTQSTVQDANEAMHFYAYPGSELIGTDLYEVLSSGGDPASQYTIYMNQAMHDLFILLG